MIPEGVTQIGKEAFLDCHSLSSVSIPESVTKTGESSFVRCNSLSSLSIPSGVTEICKDAFRECETLSDVKFGGTKAEWKSVKKGRGWHKDSPAKSVICTDGKVKL